MRAVIQRVREASVDVDGERVGHIGRGLLVLVGVSIDDGPRQADWMADKLLGLRDLRERRGQVRRLGGRRRRRGPGGLAVHPVRRHPQGPPPVLHGRRARVRRPSRSTSASSTAIAGARRAGGAGRFGAHMAVAPGQRRAGDDRCSTRRGRERHARGGFYAIHNSEIRFGRDGRWYADGQLIANPRIADLFSQHVCRRPDGGYMLRIADEQAPIVVEDTPYVVTGAELGPDGAVVDRAQRPQPRARSTRARCASATTTSSTAASRRAPEPARFLRPAYYQLARTSSRRSRRAASSSARRAATIPIAPPLTHAPALHVVLVQPEIPPNTGSIARLCAATGSRLHLVRPLGFSLDDRYLKRAGLDYWPHVDLRVHDDWAAFLRRRAARRSCSASPPAPRAPTPPRRWRQADPLYLVFGGETRGLPDAIRAAYADADLPHPDLQPARPQPQPVQRRRHRRLRGAAPARPPGRCRDGAGVGDRAATVE